MSASPARRAQVTDQDAHDPLLEYRLARNELAVAIAGELIAGVGRARALP